MLRFQQVGFRLVQQNLLRFDKFLEKQQLEGMRELMKLLRREVRRNFREVTNRRTGRLVGGIRTRSGITRDRRRDVVGTVRASKKAFYWLFIEEGTSRRNNLPALHPVKTTVDEQRENIRRVLRTAVARSLPSGKGISLGQR